MYMYRIFQSKTLNIHVRVFYITWLQCIDCKHVCVGVFLRMNSHSHLYNIHWFGIQQLPSVGYAKAPQANTVYREFRSIIELVCVSTGTARFGVYTRHVFIHLKKNHDAASRLQSQSQCKKAPPPKVFSKTVQKL